LIGEDVTGLGAVRNMSRPPAFRHPDSMTNPLYCKSGTCLEDNGGVHTNSGVNNKAVYLMVNGGTFNSRTVSPLGWSKVLTIYYEAQTNLLTSGSDYLDLYYVLYQACLNKVGENGILPADCMEVRDATLAVKMNLPAETNFNPDATYCPAGSYRAIPDVFYEGFETGATGWTLGRIAGTSVWSVSGKGVKSGSASLWADDSYNMVDAYAATRGILLPAGSKPQLYFSHIFSFETSGAANHDGGVLEYSTNNGNTWSDAKPLFASGQDYKGTIASGVGNPIQTRSGFVGDSHGMVSSRYNLTTLAGKTVRFRWRVGTDYGNSVLGWYIDDVRVYLCVGIPDVPTLLSLGNGDPVGNLTPTYDWSDSTGDLHHYELQLATNNTFTENLVTYTNILVSTHTLTSDLNPGTTYYWRVRAFNAANKTSAWSTVWSFTTP
jgi:hypothetical protein